MTRRLRPGEQELWDRVAKATDRMDRTTTFLTDGDVTPKEPPAKVKPAPKPGFTIKPFSIGSNPQTAQRTPVLRAPQPPNMDAKAYGKLARGKLRPEARMDLHGMTLSQAQPELVNFVLRSHQAGLRLVLVITGKGEGPGERGPIPYQRGILRRQVPHWLTQAPLGPLILDVVPAAPRHGGNGALYVYLRRNR